MSVKARHSVAEIMATHVPGSGDWDWSEEARQMLDPEHLNSLRFWINRYAAGHTESRRYEEPIVLGNDCRVWDGHHRIVAAWLVDPHMVLDVEHWGGDDPS